MPDIEFNCPKCKSPLKVDESGAGLTVDCPDCNEKIQIPSPKAKPAPVQSKSRFFCPHCGKEIVVDSALKQVASFCPHCGQGMPSNPQPDAPPSIAPAPQSIGSIIHTQLKHKTDDSTTRLEHRPPAHQKHLEWTPERIGSWAAKIGPNCQATVRRIMADRRLPEHAFRPCLGVIRLGDRYGHDRLERACFKALSLNIVGYPLDFLAA